MITTTPFAACAGCGERFGPGDQPVCDPRDPKLKPYHQACAPQPAPPPVKSNPPAPCPWCGEPTSTWYHRQCWREREGEFA